MSRTRVLHVITMLELGGAQRNTLDTVAGLDRWRFDVALACADEGELLPEARTISNLELYLMPSLRREIRPGRDIKALGELRRAIRAFRPTIVHTHSSKAGVLGRLAARLEGIKVIVHSIHGWGFGDHQPAPVRWAFLSAERLMAHWTSCFVAVARENLEQGVRLGLFPRERVRVIRSGIDLTAFRAASGGAELRRDLGIPDTAPLVVQVSCLKPQKAPERFVALAALLADQFPDAHFLLVGDGELRDELERRCRDARLNGRLHMPGWRRDVPAVLDAATVVTLTSRFEGLPRVVVEARAAGRCVVAMAVDGVREVISNGLNGYTVVEGDVGGMAEAVARLLRDSELRSTVAARAAEGLDEFDRDLMIRQQEELYSDLARSVAARWPT
jgi:glycosyltransferase involved in cell wall biosynthesis